MEFERAIYRVYERSMEGLINEDGSTEQNLPFYKQSCRIFEYMVLMFGFLLLFILLFLHGTYVGSKGCLPEALTIFNSTTNRTTLREFSKDTILYISIDPNYLKKKGFSHSSLLTDDNTDDLGNHHSTSARRLLKEQSSQMSAFPSQRYNRKPNHLPVTQSVLTHLYEPLSNLFSYQSIIMNAISDTLMIPNVPISPFTDRRVTMMNTTTLPNNSTNNHTDTTPTTDPRYTAFLQPFDYVVTFDWAVTILDNELRAKHDFELVNITLPGHECFGSTFAESLLPFGGLDRAVLNNVMYTLRQSGYLWTKYGDLYHWHVNDLQLYNSVASWLNTKISILWYSCLAFFLLSTTTALLVRILISSGVILIFPIFWLMQCAGLNALNLRILTISYPWIGLPLQIIQFRQQSVYPFIIAHFIRVVLYYLLYIAAQSVYLKWLYNGTTFIQGQLWLYAVMMLWEYFSMIYVRSEYSILLFPRASLGLFLIFHFYYYSFPSGFHLLALFIMFIFLIYIMTYCIRRYEVKAFRQGLVNLDQPRMLYNSLPWPSWRAELSPEYTLFMPVNQRSRTIYQNQVPALHPQTENNNNNNNNNNNVNNTNPPNINPPNQAIPSNSNSNPSSSIPSPLTTSTMSIQNNIELSTFSPINATNTISNNNNNSNGGGSNSGRSSYIVVSDIESRMNTPNANTDNTATAANNSPVSFFTRFFTTPANYQSISNNSSHHNPLNTEGVERPSNPTSSQDSLRIPLTDASNPLQSTATSTSGPSRRNTNNR